MSVVSGLALNLLLCLNNVHVIERKVKSLRIYDNTACFFRLFYASVTAILLSQGGGKGHNNDGHNKQINQQKKKNNNKTRR